MSELAEECFRFIREAKSDLNDIKVEPIVSIIKEAAAKNEYIKTTIAGPMISILLSIKPEVRASIALSKLSAIEYLAHSLLILSAEGFDHVSGDIETYTEWCPDHKSFSPPVIVSTEWD
jgi:hypothetical protein